VVSEYQVRVVADAAVDGIAVQIAHRIDGGQVMQLRYALTGTTTIDPGREMPSPSMSLPDDVARPLLAALAEHYGATALAATDRRDLLHERARVDKLIDHVIGAGRA